MSIRNIKTPLDYAKECGDQATAGTQRSRSKGDKMFEHMMQISIVLIFYSPFFTN